MAIFTLDDLLNPPSSTEVKESIYRVIAALGVNTTLWKAGAVTRAMISAFSILIASLALLIANVAKMRFRTLSMGAWLKQVAYYDYGITAREATAATTTATFTNTGGGVWDEAAGDVQVTNPATGKIYQTTEQLTLAPAGQSGDSVTIGIEAVEFGTGSNAGVGTITEMVTPLLGVTVTNPYAAVAVDDESNDELTAECDAKLEASPLGARGAYEWAAKRKGFRLDGSLVPVTSVQVSKASNTNHVTVVVAGPSGPVPGVASDPATDLGAVHWGIDLWAVPIGVVEETASATVLVIPVTYSLIVWSGSTLSDAGYAALIGTALVTFFASQPVGGWPDGSATNKVFHDAIRRAIGDADPHILSVTVALPATDVPVLIGQQPTLGTLLQSSVMRVGV
jgi:hypothetical protein